MQPSRWLLAHPQTSEEAGVLAMQAFRQALWIPAALILAGLLMVVFTLLVKDGGRTWTSWILPAGLALLALFLAQANVYKEAYHRLKAEGK